MLKHTVKEINPKKLSKHISYLDMNNLYRWTMSEYLPYSGFNSLKNVDDFDVNSIIKSSSTGYIFFKLI